MIIPSNIVQFDDLGYPLVLCLKDGEQVWIDANEKWANEQIKNGKLKVLKWEEEK